MSKLFSINHSDIWGPSKVNNITGPRWFIIFIDDHTRLCWVFQLKEKFVIESNFQFFHQMIKTQFQTHIQILHTDKGREYFNSILGTYLKNNGIVHQSTCVETPQQNGIAERKNRHLLEVVCAIMFTNNVPKLFWGEAILTASYLINRFSSKVLQFQTPLQILLQTYPHTRLI